MRPTAWLRAAAIGIAVLGVIDPVVSAERTVRHTVAVIPSSSAAGAAATSETVSRRLAARYDIVDRALPTAAATVVVGDRLPASLSGIAGPAFAMTPRVSGPTIVVTSVDAATETLFASRAPVHARLRVRGAEGARLEVALKQGQATLDLATRDITSSDQSVDVTLDFVPVTTGTTVLSVTAGLVDRPQSRAQGDVVMDVVDRTWQVLFYDRRPSWASTFVRRALEDDARFSVRSRTQTSTGVAVERGDVPASLGAVDRIDAFDAIVVGAPAALSPVEVHTLEEFAHRRGGAVVVLLDGPGSGPLGGLTRASAWTMSTLPAATPVETDAALSSRLEATELVTPTRLPTGARAIAHALVAGTRRPVAFEVPTGTGRVIVSGMIDAWRYRGVPESSAFDRFWRGTIGLAAASAPPALTVVPASTLVLPGERTTVQFTVRDLAASAPASGSVTMRATTTAPDHVTPAAGTANLQAPAVGQPVMVPMRIWPSGLPGHFSGAFVATEPGQYVIEGEAGAVRGRGVVMVHPGARRPRADELDALAAWVTTHGGQVFDETDVAGLEGALAATLLPEHRRGPWWPMRSGWWSVALAAALGAEWWLRRRADLR